MKTTHYCLNNVVCLLSVIGIALIVGGCQSTGVTPAGPSIIRSDVASDHSATSSSTQTVPFKGHEAFVSSTPISFAFPFNTTRTAAEGEATHVGHYTLTGVTVINVVSASATATLTLTAANGDQLFVSMTGHALQPFSLKETTANFTITGGTGRFEGATGSWVTDSHFAFPVNAGISPNPYEAEIEGTISTVGSNKK
jgi:hypothetical protein